MKHFFEVVMMIAAFFGIGNHQGTPPNQQVLPMKTPSWYASSYRFPSEPLFALPGAYKLTSQGIEISFPTPTASEKLIQAPFSTLCTLNRGSLVTASNVRSYSDWSVTIDITDSAGTWSTTITQGVPSITVESDLPLRHDCPNLLHPSEDLYTIDNRGILFQQQDRITRITLVPTTDQRVIDLIRSIPISPITATTVTWKQEGPSFVTTYTYRTRDNTPVLYTRWPHHGQQPLSKITYQSVLGPLTGEIGSSFTTTVPTPTLPVTFTAVTDPAYQELIRSEITKEAAALLRQTPPSGVYFRGTWLGSLASLIQLASVYDMPREKEQLLDLLQSTLLSALEGFHYDSTGTMFVADNPEFGNELGNDHHFHYGYYMRAASILAKERPEKLAQLSPVIEEMIADIANDDRTSPRYPFLRAYSIYEGHSWADGRGAFADGNNQESTSEALNAWYAIHLWGVVKKDDRLKDLGSWLFSQELSGTKSYWFGINNPFPPVYARQIASIVWGGKREFATWFSAEPMHIYGIQFLPITPASQYLDDIVTNEQINEIRARTPTVETHEWADLYTAVLSRQNPNLALQIASRVKKKEGMKLRSLLLHTVAEELSKSH